MNVARVTARASHTARVTVHNTTPQYATRRARSTKMAHTTPMAHPRLGVCLRRLNACHETHDQRNPDLQDALKQTIEEARPLATECVYLAAWNADHNLGCGHAGKNPERDLFNDVGCVSCGIECCSHTRDHISGVEVTEDEVYEGALELCESCSVDLLDRGYDSVEDPCKVCGWVHNIRRPRDTMRNMLALTKMLLDTSPLTKLGKFFLEESLKMFGVPRDRRLHEQLMKSIDYDGNEASAGNDYDGGVAWDLLENLYGLDGNPDPDTAVLLLLASDSGVCPLSFNNQ
jgi:hypothetical protein